MLTILSVRLLFTSHQERQHFSSVLPKITMLSQPLKKKFKKPAIFGKSLDKPSLPNQCLWGFPSVFGSNHQLGFGNFLEKLAVCDTDLIGTITSTRFC